MTAEEAQELREKAERVKKCSVTWAVDVADALLALLPAPPERRWPEGMAEWRARQRNASVDLDFCGDLVVCIWHTRHITPTQAERIAKWVQFAERMETAMFDWHKARASVSRHLDHEGSGLFSAIAAYRAEEGEG